MVSPSPQQRDRECMPGHGWFMRTYALQLGVIQRSKAMDEINGDHE